MRATPFTIVIGAGPSGLAACKTLAEWGIPYLCFEAGSHVVVWRGMNDAGVDVGSGVYFCTMEAQGFHDSRKMLLLK